MGLEFRDLNLPRERGFSTPVMSLTINIDADGVRLCRGFSRPFLEWDNQPVQDQRRLRRRLSGDLGRQA